jgi:soluble lytic murein transglycosylase-like protein
VLDSISRTAVSLFDRTQDGSSVPANVHAVRAYRRCQARRGRTSPRAAADTRTRRSFLAKTAYFVMIVLALFASPTSAVHAKSVSNMKRVNAPAVDPFAAFITEASQRFGISAHWIRAVMRVESAGRPHTVSAKGAMGLMQIMPKTWTELRTRYGLGNDPYDARNNVLAGAAYLRELHDRYGAPGFLAAYNAGPGRYDRHLATGRPLPAETREYVAKLAPMIEGNGVGGQRMVARSAPTWRQASLFVVRAERNSPGNRLSPAVHVDRPSNIRPVVDLSALAPQSIGLFVHRAREARPQ